MKYQKDNMFRIMSIYLTILFLGLMSASITHAESYSFVKQWGSYGTGNGQLDYPIGIAIDSSKNIYVTENGNHRIQKFDSNGNFITKWGSRADAYYPVGGQFDLPVGIAVDSQNHVYVSDRGLNWIQEFDSNGNFLTKWGSSGTGTGQLNEPVGVAIDSSSNVYVTGTYVNGIQKFDKNGNFIATLASGKFDFPSSIARDSSGNIYVMDLRQIQKFDSKGNLVTSWHSPGLKGANLAVDSSGYVYITAPGLGVVQSYDRVSKYDGNGNIIAQWGGQGSGNGYFVSAKGVAIDSSGNVYVADSVNNCIQKFAPSKTVAKFTSNVITGNAPLTVQFTDQSTGTPTSWAWDFGDGATSNIHNPTHIYSTAGNYTVTLTAVNGADSNKVTKSNYITVTNPPQPLIAAFSATPKSGNAPLNVAFTDLSSGSPTSWLWNFGDGTISNIQNPTHTYTVAGIYTVTLTATNGAGSNTATKSKYITVTSPTPVLKINDLVADVTSGYAPLGVHFTSYVSGSPTSYYWVFEPTTSSDWNSHHAVTATHTFKQYGAYSITLTVTDAAGHTDTMTKQAYITVLKVNKVYPPKANFNSPMIDQTISYGESLQIGTSYQFNDQSTNNPTSWSWDFGDGSKSTLQNPSYAYNAMGGYTVTLTVKNSAGSNTKTSYCYALVGLGDVPHAAYFSANVVSGKKPLTVKFHDDKFATDAKYNLLWIDWYFGDGTSYTTNVMGSTNPSLAYASHTYKKSGVYTVTMDCRNAAGEYVATKYHYITVK